jgi:hypothetical protein
VVGRERQHDRLRITLAGQNRGRRDRGTGIAALRLQRDGGIDAEVVRLATGEEAKIGCRHDHGRREQLGVPHAQQRLLIGGLMADEGQELLGHRVARHRPQSRAGAAREQHGNYGDGQKDLL